MQQRPAPTPTRSRLLLSVAVYAAVVTMAMPGRATSWCWEISSSDGCSNYDSKGSRQTLDGPSATCNMGSPNCDGVSITLNHSIEHIPNAVPDWVEFKILVQWAPHSDVSHYYLQILQRGQSFFDNCKRYNFSSANPLSGLFSVYSSLFHYATFEEKEIVDIKLLVVTSDEECVAMAIQVPVPVTCYDWARDCSQCGPTPFTTRLNVELVDSLIGDDQLVAHTLRWDWQPRNGRSYKNETYHVRVKGGGEERWLEVINQTKVVLDGLNSSSTYTVAVWRYECGCDRANPMGQLTLSPVDANTLSAANTQSTSSSLLISSPHSTLAPCSPSSSPLSSPSSPSSPSSHPSPSPSPSPLLTTLTNVSTSPSPHTTNTMTTILLTIVLVVATVAIAILMGILIYLKRRRRPQNEENGGIASKGGEKVIDCVNPIPSPVPVLALYSQQTPENEMQVINNLLVGGLGKFNIEVETPGTAPPRQLSRDWIERKVKTAQAVLLVCNQQFYEECQGEGDGFHVGSVAKLMLESLTRPDLEKIRCVYLTEADKRLPSPSILLRQPFYLSGGHTVEDIARFVLDIPPYP